MPLSCASNSFEALRTAASAKLDAVEKKNRSRLLFAGIVDGSASKLSLLRTALSRANGEDDVWEVLGGLKKVEEGVDGRISALQKILVQERIVKKTGKQLPFFDYLLQEEMPEGFVGSALGFREEMRDFGFMLAVDAGLVYAKKTSAPEFLAGHVVRTFTPNPVTHSEYPGWKRRGDGKMTEGVSCSIKLDSAALGIAFSEVRGFVYSRMAGADDFSKFALASMERKFRVTGFAIELNEDGERTHFYFYSQQGKGVATLFASRLEVPPETWLQPPAYGDN